MAPLGALAAALLKPRAGAPRGRLDAATSVFELFARGRVAAAGASAGAGAGCGGGGGGGAPDLGAPSDLGAGPRSVAIVTTAAIPWMTGTAVNPLLRAVHLARDGHDVTLVLPWVPSRASQMRLFPRDVVFGSAREQGVFVHAWLTRQGFGDACVRLLFYDAAYSALYGSIMPLAAITDVFAANPHLPRDVCVLEEPEHLTWHHPGSPWPRLFRVVIGVVHTNYTEYAKHFGFFGPQRAFLIMLLNMWVCRSYCHRVIKLSDAVQNFAHSVTCNVHGVRDRFLALGREQAVRRDRGAYFLAKVLWTKGYAELLALLRAHHKRTGVALPVHLYGDGYDAPAVAARLGAEPAFANAEFFRGWADHSGLELQRYRVCVNASVSEVVCTATAEALAMGKTVVCVEHPSNAFFSTFPNCHTYRTPEEFSEKFVAALARDPLPLSEDDAFRLSWVAATQRFYEAAKVPLRSPAIGRMDEALASAHIAISKLYPLPGEEFARKEDMGAPEDLKAESGERGNGGPIDYVDDASVSFSDVSDK